MRLRVAWNYGIAARGVAPRTVAVHANHSAMAHGGMMIGKGTMAGCTIIRAADRSALLA